MTTRIAFALGIAAAASNFGSQDDVMLMQVRRQNLTSIAKGAGTDALTMEQYPSGLVRAMENASLLQQAAASAGIRWSLEEAERRSSMLRHEEVLLLLQPPAPAPAKSPMQTIKDSCKDSVNVGENVNSCGAATSAGLGEIVGLFFGEGDLDFASITTTVVNVAIIAASMYFPIGGMIAGLFASTILGFLFPQQQSNQMKELAEEILKQAGKMMDTKLMLEAIGDHSVELLSIERQLEWVPRMLTNAGPNPSDLMKNTMLSFNLMIFSDLATVSAKIRNRQFGERRSDETRWAYSIMPIATYAMLQQTALLTEIASFDESFKSHVGRQLQRLLVTDVSPPSWERWRNDMIPKVNTLINNEFNRIDWTARARKEYNGGPNGPPGPCRRTYNCYVRNGNNANLFYNTVNAQSTAGCSSGQRTTQCSGWDSCYLLLDEEGNVTSAYSVEDYSDKFASALEQLDHGTSPQLMLLQNDAVIAEYAAAFGQAQAHLRNLSQLAETVDASAVEMARGAEEIWQKLDDALEASNNIPVTDQDEKEEMLLATQTALRDAMHTVKCSGGPGGGGSRRRPSPRRRYRAPTPRRRYRAPSPPPGQCNCHVPSGWAGNSRCTPSHETAIRNQIQSQFNEFNKMFTDQITPARGLAVHDDGWDWTGVTRREKDGKVFLVGKWPVEWAEKVFHLESGLGYRLNLRLDTWASVDGETCTFKVDRADNGGNLMSKTQRLRYCCSCSGWGSYATGYGRDLGVSGSGVSSWKDCYKDLSWTFTAPTDAAVKVRIHCSINQALSDEGWGFNSLFFTLS